MTTDCLTTRIDLTLLLNWLTRADDPLPQCTGTPIVALAACVLLLQP